MKVNNHDIYGLAKRLDRFIQEAHKSVSAGSSELNTFDRDRALSNLAYCTAYQTFILSQPQLDLPESHPADYELPEPADTPEVESDVINDLIRLAQLTREELVNSQSARKAAGLIGFDSGRLSAMVSKCEALIGATPDPLDLPESSPRSAMSGPGRKGV